MREHVAADVAASAVPNPIARLERGAGLRPHPVFVVAESECRRSIGLDLDDERCRVGVCVEEIAGGGPLRRDAVEVAGELDRRHRSRRIEADGVHRRAESLGVEWHRLRQRPLRKGGIETLRDFNSRGRLAGLCGARGDSHRCGNHLTDFLWAENREAVIGQRVVAHCHAHLIDGPLAMLLVRRGRHAKRERKRVGGAPLDLHNRFAPSTDTTSAGPAALTGTPSSISIDASGLTAVRRTA